MVDLPYTSRWFLDDEPLDHYAYNIERRGGSWRVPGRRGENFETPGRSGKNFNRNKPFDENLVTLQMWAQGAAEDGTVPSGDDAAAFKCRDNLDKLSRLTSFQGMRDLVRADTPEYGRRNLIPNPSMENAGQKFVDRVNIIPNPSAEYTRGDVITRHNFADNPAMERAGADVPFRTNLVRNPRFTNEGRMRVTLSNYIKNPSLESGRKFWRAQFNCKIRTSRKVRVGGSWPIQGQQSLRMVAESTGNAAVECHSINVEDDKNWTFSGYVWQRTERAMTCRIFVRWFHKNGSFISSTPLTDVVVPVEGTTRLNQTVLAASVPAGADTAAVRFVLVNAIQDDVMYIDSAMATPTAQLRSYFDGDTEEEDGTRFAWRGQASRSVSIQYRVSPQGWFSPVGNAMCTTDHSKIGVQSAKVELTEITAAGDVIFRQTIGGGCHVEEDEWYSGLISVRRQDGDDAAPTRTVKINLQCWDSNGDFLGVVTDAAGVAMPDVVLEIRPAHWYEVQFDPGGKTLEDTAKVCLSVQCGEIWQVDEVVYFDMAMVENKRRTDEWFDGNLDDDETFDYVWTEDPHWSESQVLGAHVQGWWVEQAQPQFQSDENYLRQHSMMIQPHRDPDIADRPMVWALALDLRPGRKHHLSTYVNLSRSFSVHLGISYDDGETWTFGGSEVPVAGAWERLSFGFTVPEDADPATTKIAVAYNASPVDSDFMLIDSVLFEPCQNLRRYFDGSSGRRFSWSDDPERSVSLRFRDRPTGWQGWGSGVPIIRRLKGTTTDGDFFVRSVNSEDGEIGVTFAQDGIDSELDYSFGIDISPEVARNGYVAIVWLDEEGNEVSISQSPTVLLTAGSYTRHSVVASPPIDATAAVPVAVVESALADEYVDFDAAIFGFGSATEFKDGDSGFGWRWTEEKGFSESEHIALGVDFWGSVNGTLERNAMWSTQRDHNATYTIQNGGPNCYVYAFNNNREDRRRWVLYPDSVVKSRITFSVDVRAVSVDQQVQLKLRLSRWKSQGWRLSSAPSHPETPKTLIAAGTNQRLTLTMDAAEFDIGDATHVSPLVYVFDAAGGNAVTGQVIRLDKACLSRDDKSEYIDGTYEFVVWKGEPDASHSERVGPARRIRVERVAPIDIESFSRAELARFDVQFVAPNVFWEDTIERNQRLAIPRSGGTLVFDKLDGTTAPIEDAIITVNGPITDFRILDAGTGEWIRVNIRLRQDQSVVIDNEKWEVRRGNGAKLFKHMSHSGDSVLLPITVPNDQEKPRLRITADAIGRGAWIRVVAHRKYMIA